MGGVNFESDELLFDRCALQRKDLRRVLTGQISKPGLRSCEGKVRDCGFRQVVEENAKLPYASSPVTNAGVQSPAFAESSSVL